MLQGLKFIPRDKVDGGRDDAPDGSRKGKRKSERRKKPKRSKHSRSDSSDDEGLERIKSRSRKKAKWYSSEEELSSYSESSGKSESDHRKSRRRDKRFQKGHDHTGDESSADPEAEYLNEKRIPEDVEGSKSQKNITSMRKEMGLDWMLHSKGNKELPVHPPHSEPMKDSPEVMDNPRELNPYLKNNGSGYPEDTNLVENRNRLLSSSVVGDGGASWRLKALKRAQEQAAREGMKVDEVIQERWGSVDDLAVSVESRKAAPAFAHLHATKGRRKGLFPDEMKQEDEENVDIEKFNGKKGMKDSRQNSQKMRVPRVDQSLSWGKSRRPSMSTPDSAVPSAAISNINKFSNDGSFMDKLKQVVGNADDPVSTSRTFAGRESNESAAPREDADDAGHLKLSGSANQLAARAMQLRLKGKHEEAESIMAEVAKMKERNDASNKSKRPHIDATSSSLIIHDFSERKKNREEDADVHLAQKIARNSRYSISNQADDEYDYDGSPRKKGRKKRGGEASSHEMVKSANRFLTQQERCAFCFDNPARPKHLVVSIANFTYLSLPQQQPLVPGHSCILTLQHELSTRNLDDNVWEEFRNFKKCLIMMYAKQEKEVVFLETVMQLARQRRHCMVECIPLPQNIAKQAPLYFKKAIDEAEEEWSQHNAKKLIDTSEKGLRGSIPKNFPYFHVEFGLKKGFVHVIEDEEQFKGSSFGVNVIRGMLQLPAEDMHRRRRHEPLEAQKQAVASFAREWEPFDWTRRLE